MTKPLKVTIPEDISHHFHFILWRTSDVHQGCSTITVIFLVKVSLLTTYYNITLCVYDLYFLFNYFHLLWPGSSASALFLVPLQCAELLNATVKCWQCLAVKVSSEQPVWMSSLLQAELSRRFELGAVRG